MNVRFMMHVFSVLETASNPLLLLRFRRSRPSMVSAKLCQVTNSDCGTSPKIARWDPKRSGPVGNQPTRSKPRGSLWSFKMSQTLTSVGNTSKEHLCRCGFFRFVKLAEPLQLQPHLPNSYHMFQHFESGNLHVKHGQALMVSLSNSSKQLPFKAVKAVYPSFTSGACAIAATKLGAFPGCR